VKVHPARFPAALPEFFMKLLTKEGDIVLDPFAGSNTTGRVAEDLARRWISIDVEPAYVQASAVRFGLDPLQLVDA
jgi:site-specific DNA-methyltransferase (cytosine-N4-specific)